MIVLDTNVLSELMKPRPLRSEAVFSWLRGFAPETIHTTAICMAEVLEGIGRMPAGRKRDEKMTSAEQIFDRFFASRVLAFDERSARSCAAVAGERRRRGKGTDPVDLQIAAIAHANQMAIATHNPGDFEDCGIEVIDPWEA